jgi:hypothetical protein
MTLAVLTLAAMACAAWTAAPAAHASPAVPSAMGAAYVPSAPAPPAAPTPPATPPQPSPTPTARPAPLPQPVTVTMLGIQATTEAVATVDPELASILSELKSTKFNSFRRVAHDTEVTLVGGAVELPMIEGYTLRVQPEKITAEHVTMVLTWLQADRDDAGRPRTRSLASVKMQITRGKYLLWGQWRLKDGVLLGAVAVK